MALLLDIADAVVDELNSGSFSLVFNAVRGYVPVYDLEDLADLRVTVVPAGVDAARASRGEDQVDYRVDVAVQQRAETDADADALVGLVEEIADHFRHLTLATNPAAYCAAYEHDPVYAPEHMREGRVLTSVLRLTFRAWR